MNTKIVQKIKELPKSPGVYIFRNDQNRVIYVGKAVNLKNRVSSYFHGIHDTKTIELVKNISNLEWLGTGSEFEALIVEADLIKRYKPKYNIKLRDDKNYTYVKISGGDYPQISTVHQITDHTAKYLGPFTESMAVRSILKLARHIYPYCTCAKPADETCLYYHLKLCPGHGPKYISKADYSKNIRGLEAIFSGKTEKLEREFKKEMHAAAKNQNFEKAADFRDKLFYLKKIRSSHFFSDRDLESDIALSQLAKALDFPEIPRRIECFDISNILGTAATGSMVVFKNGIAAPKDYRRFQIKTVKGANDFASMAEVLARRFRESQKSKPDKSFQELPDLVILDGGKGQLSTVLKNVEIPETVQVVALAKRLETIFSVISTPPVGIQSEVEESLSGKEIPRRASFGRNDKGLKFNEISLPPESEAFFLVQRIRDEAHRFAITYHRKLKGKELFVTSLDSIPGIGPKTKKKLLAHFGSVKNIKKADIIELSKVVGQNLAAKLKENL